MGNAMLTDTSEASAAIIRDRPKADLQPASAKKVPYHSRLGCCGGKFMRAGGLKLTPVTAPSGAARDAGQSARDNQRGPRARNGRPRLRQSQTHPRPTPT